MTGTPQLTPEFVERGYNNRAAVPDHPQWLAHYAELSAAARARASRRSSTCATARARRRRSTCSCRAGRARGTFVFIHGGYWRALDKADFSFVARPFVAQGIAVAVANYDLCPDVSIATIVDECRRAVAWIAREGAAHGAARRPLVVGGHSAGGHLAAMMFATDWRALGLRARPVRRRRHAVRRARPAPLVLFRSTPTSARRRRGGARCRRCMHAA